MTSEVLRQSITFTLNPGSGVPSYLQVVRQVEQALRMGQLQPGDQLPTAKQVVSEVAINPNTVLKAYRELENLGLVEGRQGVGTFVLRRPQGPPPSTQARLARSLVRWVTSARSEGLDDAAIEALVPFCAAGPNRAGCCVTHAIETIGLGKRFGTTWALKECSVQVPKGRVSALVGPNGAGKTTLLRLLVGLSAPTAGRAEVLGMTPGPSEEFLARIGYLAQDAPLYKRLSADDHLAIGAHLNRSWDASGAQERLAALRVPTDRPVATLSGGQRAQVALGMALAKRPQVLLLDEPVAALDPLARQEFLISLSQAVADGDLSVILSSHLLHDLERVCDHVILLASSRTEICDDIDTVLASHRMLLGPRQSVSSSGRGFDVIKATHTANQTRLLVHLDSPILDPAWDVSEVSLEEIVLAYMGMDQPVSAGSPSSVRTAS